MRKPSSDSLTARPKTVSKLDFSEVQKQNAELLKTGANSDVQPAIAAPSAPPVVETPEPEPQSEPLKQTMVPVPIRMFPDLKALIKKGAKKKRKKFSDYARDLIVAGLKRDGLTFED